MESYAEEKADLRRLGGTPATGENPFFTEITSPAMRLEIQTEAWRMLHPIWEKSLLIFSHPHPTVAQHVLPCFFAMLKFIKDMRTVEDGKCSLAPLTGDTADATFQPILKGILDHVQYPYWFVPEDPEPSSNQELFIGFREDLSRLFKRLYAVDATASAGLLTEMLRSLRATLMSSSQPPIIHPHQMEAVLFLIYLAAEHYRGTAVELQSPRNTVPLIPCLELLFSCTKLFTTGSLLVRLRMLHVVGRYLPFLQAPTHHAAGSTHRADALRMILGSLTANGDALGDTVRRTATTTLLKMVRAMGGAAIAYTSDIFTALGQANLLRVTWVPSTDWPRASRTATVQQVRFLFRLCWRSMLPQGQPTTTPPSGYRGVSFDDQNRYFELAGLLLGSFELQDSPLLTEIVDELEAPFFPREAGGTGQLAEVAATDLAAALDWTARLLDAMCNFHKGTAAQTKARMGPALVQQFERCIRCADATLEVRSGINDVSEQCVKL